MSRAADFPGDAYAQMSDDYPANTLLADTLANVDAFVLVSQRQRDFIEQRGVAGLELLPIRVRNHKAHEIPELYRMEKFVIVPKNIPNRLIFRVAGLRSYIVVRRDFAAELDKQGFTGNRWAEPAKLVGIELPPGVESLPYW